MDNYISLLFWNARELSFKSIEVKKYFIEYDIVVILETHFNGKFRFKLLGYNILEYTRKNSRGGILVAIRQHKALCIGYITVKKC